jgi:hypothetical protein
MAKRPAPTKAPPKTKNGESEDVARVGPLEIDIPRSIGYFGIIGLAVALEWIEPPIGLFIAAVPLFKLLQQRQEARPTRFVGAVLEGAAKPVGGDTEAVIRLASTQESAESQPSN